jgi:hypothetical protein
MAYCMEIPARNYYWHILCHLHSHVFKHPFSEYLFYDLYGVYLNTDARIKK